MQNFPMDPLISLSTFSKTSNHYWKEYQNSVVMGILGTLKAVNYFKLDGAFKWISGLAGEQVNELTLLLRYTGYGCSWSKFCYPTP
jgi:hypothetical protein